MDLPADTAKPLKQNPASVNLHMHRFPSNTTTTAVISSLTTAMTTVNIELQAL